MVKIKVKENGEFKATFTQKELNTISLLVGYSSDELVEKIAKDNGVDEFSTGDNLTELYNVFYRHRK